MNKGILLGTPAAPDKKIKVLKSLRPTACNLLQRLDKNIPTFWTDVSSRERRRSIAQLNKNGCAEYDGPYVKITEYGRLLAKIARRWRRD